MNRKIVQLSHLRNLVAIAKADNIIKPEEIDFIHGVMNREGLTARDYEYCDTQAQNIEFAIPEDIGERMEYLHDMIGLMMIDRDIDDRELSMCYECAAMLNISGIDNHQLVNNMIELILQEMGEESQFVTHNGKL